MNVNSGGLFVNKIQSKSLWRTVETVFLLPHILTVGSSLQKQLRITVKSIKYIENYFGSNTQVPYLCTPLKKVAVRGQKIFESLETIALFVV